MEVFSTLELLSGSECKETLDPTSADLLQQNGVSKASDLPFGRPVNNTHATPVCTSSLDHIPNQGQHGGLKPKPRDLTVTARLRDHDNKLLVDTAGAGISVIDEEFLLNFYADQLPVLHKSSSNEVKTVSGETLPILGTAKVSLEIAGGRYSCEFHVVKNLPYEAVLSRDFLRANGAATDLTNSTLQLEDSQFEPCKTEASPVRAWSTCVIPPSFEVITPAYLDAPYSPGVVGVLETSSRLVEG